MNFGTIILLYHRIADWETDPQLLCVTPKHFTEHLEILKELGPIVSFSQLNHTDRASIITFDDGYADNLHNAKPILQCQDVPATVFIATGQVGQTTEFWWDELERLLLQPDLKDQWNVERPD